jgi:WD40 repeat protein/serine/threonine protein kinase
MTGLPENIDQIFWSALQLESDAERQAYVERVCGGDAEQRRLVEKLLRAQPKAAGFLEQPLGPAPATLAEPMSEGPGTVIGPYKLLEQIGEGGFGVVFMAEQTQPVRRKVALKILKPGMDTRQVVARFEAERQALAIMDHPNIAKVLDGGQTASGRPYVVMDLVKGLPVTEYCNQAQLTPRERLQLFIHLCQAVQHAHQKGVIHRDLKPSNVMVMVHDTTPVVKVIDFGVAKALGQELTDKTLFTGFAQMVGTPLYMSPEQAGQSGVDVDTRSDIYSLGVLLYELLTGATPFDKERLKEIGYDELRRIIREEEPPKPSTRISALGQAATAVSTQRKSDAKQLSRLLRGELDWIVMKALEKDRNRRYETANAFAADVQRHLADEPVLACAPSRWYRFRKFARRNKGVLAVAGSIAAALVLAVTSLCGAVSVLAASNAEIKEEQRQTQKAFEGEKNAKEELLDALKREQRTLYLKRIALAERELAANNIGRVEEILDDCPLSLRGWEWRYLRRGRGPFTFRGHRSWVRGVAFSPDGKQVASSSSLPNMMGEIKVWEAGTGREVRGLLGHTSPAFGVAFHPNGKQLASAGWDRNVRIWDLQTGKQVGLLKDHRQYVTSVAYSRDGKLLASAGGDNVIIIWDALTLQKLRTLRGLRAIVTQVAFAPDSRRLASASYGETIRLWDATTGQELYALRDTSGLLEKIVFSPDGRTMLSAEFDGTIRSWDVASGQQRFTIQGYPGIAALALSPDGRRLASAGFERPVHIWDLESGQEALVLRGHTEHVSDLAFSPDGEQLASASMDGTVKIWDASTAPTRMEAEMLTLRGHQGCVNDVAFHPDNKRLASASTDGTAKLWDATSGAELDVFPGQTSMVAGVDISRDGRILATVGYGGDIKIWDIKTAKKIRGFHGFKYGVALSPDGTRVAAVVEGNQVCIWNTATGQEELPPFRVHAAPTQRIAFSPDGRQLATASFDTTAALWDARTGRKLHTLRGHGRVVMNAAFSADGKRLATASLDKTAKVWDTATGKELVTMRGHDDRVLGVAFSPDGKLLATASWDNTARVWDALTGKEIDSLRGHSGYVNAVVFSRDGTRLASAGGHRTRGEVKIWDTASWYKKLDPK